MSAVILPFPLARRRNLIERQARYAAELSLEAADRHIQQQLKVQFDTMTRKGIKADLIRRELRCFEAAIRASLWKANTAPGGCA